MVVLWTENYWKISSVESSQTKPQDDEDTLWEKKVDLVQVIEL
jgi:hypothetical protein